MNSTCSATISNSFLPKNDRFQYWADTVCQTLNPIALDSSERHNFCAEIDILKIANTSLVRSKGSNPVSARRTRAHIAQADDHTFHLVIKLAGKAVVTQGKKTAIVQAGDLILVDTKQSFSATMEDSESVMLSVPQALMHTWIPNPEDYVGQSLQGNIGWTNILQSYLQRIDVEMISNTNEHQHRMMVEHILSLYSFALEESNLVSDDTTPLSTLNKTGLYKSMYSWLKENFVNPDISTIHIANHFSVSTREIHRQFALATSGFSFLDTLRKMRMTAAVRMLKDPKFATLTIAEIGYRCGFDDPAYFGKVFRKFLGMSPGAFSKANGVVAEENMVLAS